MIESGNVSVSDRCGVVRLALCSEVEYLLNVFFLVSWQISCSAAGKIMFDNSILRSSERFVRRYSQKL